MHIPAVNVTILIAGGLVAGALYGWLAGKQRLRILILSVYVGIVLSSQMEAVIAPMAHSLGADQISWALLLLPILIFGFFGVTHAKHHPHGSHIANLIVGLLTAALIISSGIHLLPISEGQAIDSQSFLATNLEQLYLWIIGLLPVVALVLGWMPGGGEHKHH